MGPLAQVGLALATAIGAWINLGLVFWFALRAGHARIDARLRQSAVKLAAAGLALAVALWLCRSPVATLFVGLGHWRDLATLGLLAVVGAVVYGGMILALIGPGWLRAFRAKPQS